MYDESKSWYRMTRPLFNSGYEDDEFWAYGQEGFQEILDSFIGCDVQIFEKSLQNGPTNIRAIIQNVTGDTHGSSTIRQILCNVGTLRCGQYVKFNDGYWIVSGLPDNNRIYEKAVLWKCKYTIRFISPLTGEIVEYPVSNSNSTQYGTGELEKSQITIGDSQHIIHIPYNDETVLIDDRFRFIMDRNRNNPTVYRVTQVDTTSYAVGSENEDGLIQWSALETQFNDKTDNRELMIADYYLHDISGAIPDSEIGIALILTDLDGDNKIAIGEEKQIRVRYVGEDGTEKLNFDFSVDVSDPLSVEVVTCEGDLITLRAIDDDKNVGKKVFVSVAYEDMQISETMEIQVVYW